MEMGTGGLAAHADLANQIASHYALGFMDQEFLQMAINRLIPTAMIDNDEVAVNRVIAGFDHYTVAAGDNRAANGGDQV